MYKVELSFGKDKLTVLCKTALVDQGFLVLTDSFMESAPETVNETFMANTKNLDFITVNTYEEKKSESTDS